MLSNSLFRQFFETSVQMQCIIDGDGTLHLVSDGWTGRLGWKRADVAGRNLQDFVLAEDRDALARQIASLAAEQGRNPESMAQRAVGRFSLRLLDTQGQPHALDMTGFQRSDGGMIRVEFCPPAPITDGGLHLQRSQEIAGIGSWEIDLRSRHVYWSDTTHQIHETDPATYAPAFDDALQYYPAEARARIAANVERLLQEGKAYKEILPFVTANGRKRWVETTAAAEIEDGVVTRAYGTIRDVTEKRERDLQFRQLGDVARRTDNLVVIADADRRIVWVNRAFEIRTGYTLEEVQGQKPGAFLQCPDTDQATVARIRAALEAVEGVRAQLMNRDRHGEIYWVDLDIRPTFADDGRLSGFVAVQTDMTEQKAREAEFERLANEARQARQQLENALEALPDGVVIFDKAGKLVVANSQYRSLYPEFADAAVEGATMEDMLRYALAHGAYPAAMGQEEAWLATKLEEHRSAERVREVPHTVGRWLRVLDLETSDGGSIGVRLDVTERRRQYAALEKANARLQRTLSARDEAERRLGDIIYGAEAGTWEWDLRSGENRINARWAEMVGYDLGEIRAFGIDFWRSLLHPDDLPHVEERLAQVFRNEVAQFDYEMRMRHKEGHWVWVQSRGRVVQWTDSGQPLLMAGVHLDIDDRKNAEQRLDDIVNAAEIGTWELDLVEGSNRINERWAAMLGYPYEDLAEMTREEFLALVHPDDQSDLFSLHASKMPADARRFEMEFRLRHRDGRWIWVFSTGRVTRQDANGKATAMSGIHLDITDRKSHEAALLAANADLQAALAARDAAERRFFDIAKISRDWFWENDEDGRFTYISESHPIAMGRAACEWIGKTRQELLAEVPEVLKDADWEWLFACMGRRESFNDFVYRTPDGYGGELWVRISGAPFYRLDGSFAGYRGVGSDVTALYAAKERAEEANRSKSLFLANMSHEIRTPLNGVLGMAELLGDAVTEPRHKSMIGTIRESGEALLNVLNDILDMSKIEAGKLDLEEIPLRPSELASKIEGLHSLRAQEKGLSFAVHAGQGADRLRMGDPHRILQVLHNLLSNAIKFTERGTVEAHIEAPEGEPVSIVVQDSGIGMTSEQVATIFDDFQQADGTVTRRFGGTGLGMAIVRRLVEMMGGSIDVTSRPSQGTTIRVVLPLQPGPEGVEPGTMPVMIPPATRRGAAVHPADAEAVLVGGFVDGGAAPGDAGAASHAARGLAGLRVLAADDNGTNRLILKAMLSSMGADIVMVEDGRKAVDAWGPGRFDLFLLDISMPEMDGISALAALRDAEALAGLPAAPAIAITANAMSHQIAQYLDAGFDAHVGKPFRRDGLLQAITAVMSPG